MALPRVNNPTYTLELPSTGKEIKYRPFLVKEQKSFNDETKKLRMKMNLQMQWVN